LCVSDRENVSAGITPELVIVPAYAQISGFTNPLNPGPFRL